MKRTFFWTVYGLLLAAITIGGLEFVASFLTPPWPAYDLRPIDAAAAPIGQIKALAGMPDLIPRYNSWGLRDRERSFSRPADVRFRSVLVGDSFLEGAFLRAPLAQLVEQDWRARGMRDGEAINLGVSATGPVQYYYRIETVALKLEPDAILELVYPGNDFVRDRFSPWSIPPLVAERPEPSLLGAVAPHLDWLIVNRLGLSEFGRGNKPIPDEFDILNDVLQKPRDQRAGLLADYLGKNYFPGKSRETMREILGRGGDAFWAAFEHRKQDPEFLQGWLLASMIDWETGTWPVPHDSAEADRMVDMSEVDSTSSWLLAADRLATANGVRFLLAVAPMGSVDPRFAAFWQPWPRFYSINLARDAARRRLLAELRRKGLQPIDLEEDLKGVSGTYRLTDGHWTQRGTEIVAKRIADELAEARTRKAARAK
ncbi:hypothetical protein [Enhydrobacter sp.]|jgi:hypothetical protein|uniref:alginate O-acetyltransferase AlgX-related protein n=1 Tax=Enhydrobacter sp. TaxID=1894999 RepID=UPI002620CEC2|nr:hypothetical protein [Enhydrobacter sp.]WIM09522.1 MAG: hypothetical protein OJF58_000473 [Enhydrobacter sp.]